MVSFFCPHNVKNDIGRMIAKTTPAMKYFLAMQIVETYTLFSLS